MDIQRKFREIQVANSMKNAHVSRCFEEMQIKETGTPFSTHQLANINASQC